MCRHENLVLRFGHHKLHEPALQGRVQMNFGLFEKYCRIWAHDHLGGEHKNFVNTRA
jgi:hypothetical protein